MKSITHLAFPSDAILLRTIRDRGQTRQVKTLCGMEKQQVERPCERTLYCPHNPKVLVQIHLNLQQEKLDTQQNLEDAG
jgi:hypothetical protein